MRNRAKYYREYRAKKRAEKNWSACHRCGQLHNLIILDARPKDKIPADDLRHVKAACPNCLFKDQPLLLD